MGKLTAFVDIFVESRRFDEVVEELRRTQGIKMVYEVTGEFDIIVLVESDGTEGLRAILKDRIMKIHGVRSTVTDVVMMAHEPYDGSPLHE